MKPVPLDVTWLRLPGSARDLLPVFAAARGEDRFHLEGDAGDGPRAVLAVGVAHVLAVPHGVPGVNPDEAGSALAALARGVAALRARVRAHGEAVALGGAGLVGGAAFDPAGAPGSATASGEEAGWAGFPAGRLWVPRLLVLAEPEGLRVAVAGTADPAEARGRAEALLAASPPGAAFAPGGAGEADQDEDADEGQCAGARLVPRPAPGGYRRRVARALEAIAAGRVEKLVVARACRLESAAPLDPVRALARLRAAQSHGRVFAVARGKTTFLGASPECLVAVRRDPARGGPRLAPRIARVDAVAGSAPRAPGGRDDAARARALRERKKDQEEHAVVVRAVAAALGEVAGTVRAPESPEVVAVDGLLHLRTAFEVRLDDPETGLLDLATRLHPTPAVGGAPRDEARAWLRAHEGLDRGWYAGPLGLVGLDGTGELHVALRCARVEGRAATLYAGAGVVRGSEPEAELEETRQKLRPALGALLEI